MLRLYDLDHFGGGLIVDLRKTHPKLLIGPHLIENPYYMTPDEYRDQWSSRVPLSELGSSTNGACQSVCNASMSSSLVMSDRPGMSRSWAIA
jgi:hypothetical protein